VSVMGNRSDRRPPNLANSGALEAVGPIRKRRADSIMARSTRKLLTEAEYTSATGVTLATNGLRPGLGPYTAVRIHFAPPNRRCEPVFFPVPINLPVRAGALLSKFLHPLSLPA